MRTLAILYVLSAMALGDGKIVPPRDYEGSLEERSQEAIIVFHSSKVPGEAIEELILKITVEGKSTNATPRSQETCNAASGR